MEVVVVPHKQIKTPRRCANSRFNSFFSMSSENFAPSNIHGGFSFYPPPYLSSPSLSSTHHQQIHRQPPLLPLPIHHRSLPSSIRDFSSSPPKPAQKVLKPRDHHSLTPKNSESPGRNKDPKPYFKSSTSVPSRRLISVSTADVDLSSVLPPSPSSLSFIGNDFSCVNLKEFEKFSGSVFTISPHPSRLPLPKFSIKSKVACKVEATGVDAGATDNLRRLLRLR